MTEPDDIALLRTWTEDRSEAAFRRVVERYAPLVWGAALRKTNDRSLAEEAVQQVFTDLARKAPVLVALGRPLAPWLHRAAVYEAMQGLRRELRHRDRMKHYADTAPEAPPPQDPWEEIRPLLDDAISALPEADRRVLLLHWFERQTFAQVAERTGSTPAAAQRRGLRALEKLASTLRQRGPVVPAAVLAAGLTAALSPQAPAALISSVAAASAAAATSTGGLSLFTQHTLHAMSSAKLATAVVFLLAASLPVGVSSFSRGAWSAGDRADRADPTDLQESEVRPQAAATVPAALDLGLVQRAIQRLLANPEDYQAELDLRRLMFSLEAGELAAVRELLMAVPGKKKEALHEVSLAFFARWAELDPLAAVEAALAVPKSAYGFYPLRGAFVTWAGADLDAAWAWLSKPGRDTFDRNFLGGEALASLAADPAKSPGIMARVDAMTDEAWKKELRYWVLRAWVQTSRPPAAMDWAQGLADEGERAEWLGKAVEMAGTQNPVSGLDNLKRIENPDRRAEVAHNILWPWLLAQPQEAFAALKKQAEELPANLFRDAGDAMTRHDSAKAVEALQQLAEGEPKKEFIEGMFTGVAYSEAAPLLPVLAAIPAEELTRHSGFGHFTDMLSKQNPRAAAEWITSLPADSDTRKYAASHFKGVVGSFPSVYLNSLTK